MQVRGGGGKRKVRAAKINKKGEAVRMRGLFFGLLLFVGHRQTRARAQTKPPSAVWEATHLFSDRRPRPPHTCTYDCRPKVTARAQSLPWRPPDDKRRASWRIFLSNKFKKNQFETILFF